MTDRKESRAPTQSLSKSSWPSPRTHRDKPTAHRFVSLLGRLGEAAVGDRSRQGVATFLKMLFVAACVASCNAGSTISACEEIATATQSSGVDASNQDTTGAVGATSQGSDENSSQAASGPQSTPATGTTPGSQENSTGGTQTNPMSTASSLTCPGLGDWDAASSQFEDEVLLLLNEARQKGANCGGVNYPPVPPVVTDAAIHCVARRYAKNMSDNNFFEHEGKDGSTISSRADAGGVSWRSLGENIGMGHEDPTSIMKGWLNSPGHCKNLMSKWKTVGIGFYKSYWVQDFVQ